MKDVMKINGRVIAPGEPAYIVAEMSANHGHSLERALQIVEAAAMAGADAIKLQTYTADTLTLDCDNAYFRIGDGTLWSGRTLHDLYSEAYTPWEWHDEIKQAAEAAGIDFFSSPFDATAIEFLESLDVPAYKIASFEIVDLALIRAAASTGKPLIISTGLATTDEIADAVTSATEAGATGIALLKCTSAYPSPPEEVNLRAIPAMASEFDLPIGLSDHTTGIAVPVAAVSLGICMIEKHFKLDRDTAGPDSAFSLAPDEFRAMVEAVRIAEVSLGASTYEPGPAEEASRMLRRSLFVVSDVSTGDAYSAENVKSIRPGAGLAPRFLPEVLGRSATRDVARGTPLSWDLVGD